MTAYSRLDFRLLLGVAALGVALSQFATFAQAAPSAPQARTNAPSKGPLPEPVARPFILAQAPINHDNHGAPPILSGNDIFKVGPLIVASPWTRATPGGAKIGGGYFKVTNNGSNVDRLVGATTSAADHIEIHEMLVVDGVMKMRPLTNGLEIRPGETVELKPGGFHMMFVDLKQPLKKGGVLTATMTFEKAGPVKVNFSVYAVGVTHGSHHH